MFYFTYIFEISMSFCPLQVLSQGPLKYYISISGGLASIYICIILNLQERINMKFGFYNNFPPKVEAELRDGPQFMSAYRLAQKLTVRELVSLGVINGVVDPAGEPGKKA
jgi:hypothetical protein